MTMIIQSTRLSFCFKLHMLLSYTSFVLYQRNRSACCSSNIYCHQSLEYKLLFISFSLQNSTLLLVEKREPLKLDYRQFQPKYVPCWKFSIFIIYNENKWIIYDIFLSMPPESVFWNSYSQQLYSLILFLMHLSFQPIYCSSLPTFELLLQQYYGLSIFALHHNLTFFQWIYR